MKKLFPIILAMCLIFTIIPTSETEAAYVTGNYLVTTSDGLNLRNGAGIGYEVKVTIPYGTIVNVTKISGSWGYTEYKTYYGWINVGYAQKTSKPTNWTTTASSSSSTTKTSTTSNKTTTTANVWYQSGSYWYLYNSERKVTFKSNNMHTAYTKIKGKASGTNYYAVLDQTKCQLYIFKKSGSGWVAYKAINVSVGASNTPTVKGTFTISDRGYSFSGDNYTCYYWTRFYGNYMFHSVLYQKGTQTVLNGTLGAHISHGCVRMSQTDAKWIYNNLASGTKVLSY